MLLDGFLNGFLHLLLRVGFGRDRRDGGVEEPLLEGLLFITVLLFYVEDGQGEREGEEDAAEPAGDGLEHIGALCAEEVVGHPAAKRRPETFAFWPLHEDEQDDQQRNEDVDREENIDDNGHDWGADYGGKVQTCKMEVFTI